MQKQLISTIRFVARRIIDNYSNLLAASKSLRVNKAVTSEIQTFTILMANDSEDVCFLVQEALREVPLAIAFYSVENGEKLLDYLYRRDRDTDARNSPYPNLILLDLNMPKLDGKEAIAMIKSNPNFCHIPIVVLTTSQQDGDILHCYRLGANSFIVKPITFDALVEVMNTLCRYWFGIVSLPPE
ncbi:response regulator [Kamptonema sp. UHCC 0994]|uniref:response regulator n=1 Tax=Kamptonema sp. UHCC 0994 TaxID=3031329 RepID=UPI0023B96939|nr:response regulator [Kamptonema sp. UHCC 0994]MDF0554634.1 response regulator [Kamptonema sp. UHCC 0994]